jgi:hypothetical protein
VDDVAEHLDQPPVGVPREPLVVGGASEPVHGGVVEPHVEDRVEHPGHRVAGAAAHRHQQRIFVVAEPFPRGLLQPLQSRRHLLVQALRLGSGLHVRDARLGRDREAGRDPIGAEHPGHLGDVRPLSAEQVAHFPRTLGEVIHPFVV